MVIVSVNVKKKSFAHTRSVVWRWLGWGRGVDNTLSMHSKSSVSRFTPNNDNEREALPWVYGVVGRRWALMFKYIPLGLLLYDTASWRTISCQTSPPSSPAASSAPPPPCWPSSAWLDTAGERVCGEVFCEEGRGEEGCEAGRGEEEGEKKVWQGPDIELRLTSLYCPPANTRFIIIVTMILQLDGRLEHVGRKTGI